MPPRSLLFRGPLIRIDGLPPRCEFRTGCRNPSRGLGWTLPGWGCPEARSGRSHFEPGSTGARGVLHMLRWWCSAAASNKGLCPGLVLGCVNGNSPPPSCQSAQLFQAACCKPTERAA